MTEFYQVDRSVVKRNQGRLLARGASCALLAFLVGSVPVLAQSSDCDPSQLSRPGDSTRQLAVRIGGEWKLFPRNTQAAPHVLDLGLGGDRSPILCMAWEAPRSLSSQVVYVSTRFTDQKHLSLFRSGIVSEDQSRARPLAGLIDDFQAYHGDGDRHLPAAPELEEDLESWHRRSTSYNLVSDAVVVDHNLPFGSERLLTLLPLRVRKSWVRITGQIPLEAETLDVVVAYSGDRSAGAHAYRYWFEIR